MNNESPRRGLNAAGAMANKVQHQKSIPSLPTVQLFDRIADPNRVRSGTTKPAWWRALQ
jgi:hypothetical protein